MGVILDEAADPRSEPKCRVAVIPHSQQDQGVGDSHNAQPDLAVAERIPIQVPGVLVDERGEVDRAEVARLVWEQRHFAARVGGLDPAKPGRGVVLVNTVDEADAGFTRRVSVAAEHA